MPCAHRCGHDGCIAEHVAALTECVLCGAEIGPYINEDSTDTDLFGRVHHVCLDRLADRCRHVWYPDTLTGPVHTCRRCGHQRRIPASADSDHGIDRDIDDLIEQGAMDRV